MKRRSFLLAAGALAMAIPIINYSWSQIGVQDPLSFPTELARFCDESTIRQIGQKYRNLVPKENLKEKLVDLLMIDISGQRVQSADKSWLRNFMDKKIQEDFSQYRTIMIEGWIISLTEARQCALYSIR